MGEPTMIHIASKRRKIENILKDFPDAEIIDVTSKAPFPYQKFYLNNELIDFRFYFASKANRKSNLHFPPPALYG